MGKAQRDLGKRGELWVVKKMVEHGYKRARRGVQFRGGRDGCDVMGTPFWMEVKFGKNHYYEKALRKTVEDSDGRPAVVVHKKPYKDAMVSMEFKTFLWIVENFMSPAQVEEYVKRGVDEWPTNE